MNLKSFFATEICRRRAVFLLKAESGLLLAIVIYLILAPIISEVSVPSALYAEIVFGALGAAGLWGCAIGFQKARSFGRAPAVLANLIALGVSYYMITGNFLIVGVPLLFLSLLTIISAALGYKE